MRLAVDISSIPFGTGVSRYTANLIKALIPLLGQDELVLFGSSLRHKQELVDFYSSLSRPASPAGGSIACSLYPYPPKLTSFLFNTLHLSIDRFTRPVNVFHAWDWQVPAMHHGALVSTVHDLALFKFPDLAHSAIKTQHTKTLRYLKNHAQAIIAVSQSTKADLVELFAINPDIITVIPEALPVELMFTVDRQAVDAVKQKYHLTKPYFLMVGAGDQRKNFDLQYQSWLHYRSNYDLVVTGDLTGQIIKPASGLITPGYVAAADLAALYREATLLLYVSHYEGFGLPILEAFYHQCPVVTANLSGMAEVAGPAAVYADPSRPETIMMAIGQVMQNRNSLINQGLERLKLFSWDAVARQTLAVYHHAAELRH